MYETRVIDGRTIERHPEGNGMYRYEENQVVKKEVPGLTTSPHRVTVWEHSESHRLQRARTLWSEIHPYEMNLGEPKGDFDREWERFEESYPLISAVLLPMLNDAGHRLAEAKAHDGPVNLGPVYVQRNVATRYPTGTIEVSLERLAAGDLGMLGKILARDLSEDERFAPPLFQDDVQATAALSRGVGVVAAVYDVPRDRKDNGPRTISLAVLLEGGAPRTIVYDSSGGYPERL